VADEDALASKDPQSDSSNPAKEVIAVEWETKKPASVK